MGEDRTTGDNDERAPGDEPATPDEDAGIPDGDEPLEESDAPFTDDDADISGEVQQEVRKLENAVWHAPRGRGTRVAAMVILLLLAGSLIALTVLAIITAAS